MLGFEPIYLASNPVLFPMHYPGGHTSWQVRGTNVTPGDWGTILPGACGKPRHCFLVTQMEPLGPAKPFTRGPSGTRQGALHSFDEAHSFPSSLCLLMTHSQSDAPKLLLHEALVFKICFYSKKSLFGLQQPLCLRQRTHHSILWMSTTAQTPSGLGVPRDRSPSVLCLE